MNFRTIELLKRMSFIESTTTRGTADKIELSFDYIIYVVAMIGRDKWEMGNGKWAVVVVVGDYLIDGKFS